MTDARAAVNAVMKRLNESRLQERAPKACKSCSQKHRKCEFKLNNYPKCDECSKKHRECIFNSTPPPPVARQQLPDDNFPTTSGYLAGTDPRSSSYMHSAAGFPSYSGHGQDVSSMPINTPWSSDPSGGRGGIPSPLPGIDYPAPSNSVLSAHYGSRPAHFPPQSTLPQEGHYSLNQNIMYQIPPQDTQYGADNGHQEYADAFNSPSQGSGGCTYYQHNTHQ